MQTEQEAIKATKHLEVTEIIRSEFVQTMGFNCIGKKGVQKFRVVNDILKASQAADLSIHSTVIYTFI